MDTHAVMRDDPGTALRYEVESWTDGDAETSSVFVLDRDRALELAWKGATYGRRYVMVYERRDDEPAHPIARYL